MLIQYHQFKMMSRLLYVARLIPACYRMIVSIAVLGALALACASCHDSALNAYSETRFHMGTSVEITIIGKDREQARAAADRAFSEVARIERLMSPRSPDSDVGRINSGAGGPGTKVSQDTLEVVSRSLPISELSDGAFDVTVAGLGKIWRINDLEPRVASEQEIASRLPLIGWQKVKVDQARQTVALESAGMKIDLGGVAKGYAVDLAIQSLKDDGIAMALVNAGGDLRALGRHNRRPWKIAIQDPRDRQGMAATLEIQDMAVATSGDYEKYFEKDGVRYCHIIDPRSGRPADTVRSVTVIAPEAWRADALATAAFVLGPEQGLAMIERLPGVECVIIGKSGQRKVSGGMMDKVNWLAP